MYLSSKLSFDSSTLPSLVNFFFRLMFVSNAVLFESSFFLYCCVELHRMEMNQQYKTYGDNMW